MLSGVAFAILNFLTSTFPAKQPYIPKSKRELDSFELKPSARLSSLLLLGFEPEKMQSYTSAEHLKKEEH